MRCTKPPTSASRSPSSSVFSSPHSPVTPPSVRGSSWSDQTSCA